MAFVSALLPRLNRVTYLTSMSKSLAEYKEKLLQVRSIWICYTPFCKTTSFSTGDRRNSLRSNSRLYLLLLLLSLCLADSLFSVLRDIVEYLACAGLNKNLC
jgi:hypothetical protein